MSNKYDDHTILIEIKVKKLKRIEIWDNLYTVDIKKLLL